MLYCWERIKKILATNLLLYSDSWLSFCSRMLWSIILNAFLISSNTVIDICVVYIYFPITCTVNQCKRCGMRWSQPPLIVIQNFVIYQMIFIINPASLLYWCLGQSTINSFLSHCPLCSTEGIYSSFSAVLYNAHDSMGKQTNSLCPKSIRPRFTPG